MVIDLESLFAGGTNSIELDYEFDFSGEKVDDIFPFAEPVEISGEITNKSGLVELNAVVTYGYTAPCARCLEDTTVYYDVDISYTLACELVSEDNDDYLLLADKKLRLDELVFEEVLLDLPMVHLCDYDCKGLCSQCGKNLNEGSCDCKKPIDPRLAVFLDM